MARETVWVFGQVKRETELAILFSDSKNEGWVPRSQILDEEGDIEVGNSVKIEIPLWIAEDKGFS